MKSLIFTFLFLQMGAHAFAQTTHMKWYRYGGDTYCGEFTNDGNNKIQNVSDAYCRASHPVEYNWYRYGGGTYCGEYTPEGYLIKNVIRRYCDAVHSTFADWRRYGGDTYCSEYTIPEHHLIQNLSLDVCRKSTGPEYPLNKPDLVKPVVPQITVAQINDLLQVAEGTQVIIAADIAIPARAGRGAAKEASGTIQCYIGQKKADRTPTLYHTKNEIIQVGRIQMTENRVDIMIELLDADDLGSILCRSKNNSATNIENLDGLIKALEDSGIKFKDPGYLSKKLNRMTPAATSQQQMLQDFEL